MFVCVCVCRVGGMCGEAVCVWWWGLLIPESIINPTVACRPYFPPSRGRHVHCHSVKTCVRGVKGDFNRKQSYQGRPS